MSAPDLTSEVRMIQLLERVASHKRPCKYCGALIYFVVVTGARSASGLPHDGQTIAPRRDCSATIPYTAQGRNHFEDCPHIKRPHGKPPLQQQQSLIDTLPDALEPSR